MIKFEYGKKYPLKVKSMNRIKVIDEVTCTGRRPTRLRFETNTKVYVCMLDETNDSEMAILPYSFGERFLNIYADEVIAKE